jgi:hypothetical protein
MAPNARSFDAKVPALDHQRAVAFGAAEMKDRFKIRAWRSDRFSIPGAIFDRIGNRVFHRLHFLAGGLPGRKIDQGGILSIRIRLRRKKLGKIPRWKRAFHREAETIGERGKYDPIVIALGPTAGRVSPVKGGLSQPKRVEEVTLGGSVGDFSVDGVQSDVVVGFHLGRRQNRWKGDVFKNYLNYRNYQKVFWGRFDFL